MPIYMKYGKINGEATAKGHEKWIEVNSFQWGLGRGISSPVGGSTKREASAPSVSEITVSKVMDSTSPLFAQEGLIGKGEKCEFHFVTTGADKLETYLTVVLEGAMLSGYSASSGGDRPSESLSINFTKIEYTYQGYKDGTPDSTLKQTVTYDLAQATKV